MTPPLKQPYVQKHIHSWRIVERSPKRGAYYDYWKQKDIPASDMRLVRECDVCTARQSALVPDESVLVTGYEAVADVEWKNAK